jgi:hypothetical protein
VRERRAIFDPLVGPQSRGSGSLTVRVEAPLGLAAIARAASSSPPATCISLCRCQCRTRRPDDEKGGETCMAFDIVWSGTDAICKPPGLPAGMWSGAA